ncbi:MAG: hypothetical protein D6770_01310 [Anaerolineae bacterium]|nr:MAG: hypothetical protein D6770_01310 [Anaerolineae bacterium]
MISFLYTELEEGEEVVFGPVRQSQSTSFRLGPAQPMSRSGWSSSGQFATPQQGVEVERTRGHVVGVTNRRVIWEDLLDSSKTRIVANEAVRQVFIKHKTSQGRPMITLDRVVDGSGQSIKLNLEGIPAQKQEQLQALFPNAEIRTTKGVLGSKGCMIALIVVAVLFALSCVAPVIVYLLGQLFQ